MADVVVVGSLNVDLVVRVARLPGPGETVTGGSFTRAFGGKGANAASAAARLGARTWIVGMVGDDDLGVATQDDLTGRGVDLSHLGAGQRHTGVAVITVDDQGENAIAVAGGANVELSASHVARALRSIEAEGAVVQANLEIPDDAVLAAARGAHKRGWLFVLNPAPAHALPPGLLPLVDVLTPNQHEVALLGPGSVDELLRAGAGAVVVTRGAAGADLHRPVGELHHQDAFAAPVVDTTGAGDAFTATLAWALANRRDLEEAVRLAAAGGALACREIGARASLGTREEVEGLAAR